MDRAFVRRLTEPTSDVLLKFANDQVLKIPKLKKLKAQQIQQFIRRAFEDVCELYFNDDPTSHKIIFYLGQFISNAGQLEYRGMILDSIRIYSTDDPPFKSKELLCVQMQNKVGYTSTSKIVELLWRIHGCVLCLMPKDAEIIPNRVVTSFIATFSLQYEAASELATQNFCTMIEMTQKTTIPIIESVVKRINYHVRIPRLRYIALTTIVTTLGLYTDIHANFDEYVTELKKDKTDELIDLIIALIRVFQIGISSRSYIKLLDVLSIDDQLLHEKRSLEILNEVIPLYLVDVPVGEKAEWVLKNAQSTDEGYQSQLRICRILMNARFY